MNEDSYKHVYLAICLSIWNTQAFIAFLTLITFHHGHSTWLLSCNTSAYMTLHVCVYYNGKAKLYTGLTFVWRSPVWGQGVSSQISSEDFQHTWRSKYIQAHLKWSTWDATHRHKIHGSTWGAAVRPRLLRLTVSEPCTFLMKYRCYVTLYSCPYLIL